MNISYKTSYFFKTSQGVVPFEDACVVSAKLKRKTLAADEFIFEIPSDCAGAFAPVCDETFKVIRGDSAIFEGAVQSWKNVVKSGRKYISYTAKNAWCDLEKIVFQQVWKNPADPSSADSQLDDIYKSRVILGQNASGETQNVSGQAMEILSYALEIAGSFRIGDVSLDSPMVMDEVRDLSCAEALKKTLAWTPDAVSNFEYFTDDLPKINLVRGGSLPSVNVDILSGDVLEYSVAPRPDLTIPGVCVKYEKTNVSGDSEWVVTTQDIWPEGFQQRTPRAIIMTVELDGERYSVRSNVIESQPISPNSKDWWLEKFPAYKDSSYTNIEISDISRLGSLGRELRSGSIYTWMGGALENDVIGAKISYIRNGTSAEKYLKVRLRATNLYSGTYYRTVQTQTGENAPEGLAKAIYEACSSMRYEGQIVFALSDFSEKIGLNGKINLIGAGEEFENMNCAVSSVEEDFLSGRKKVYFGPPKHLYPDDITELFRINRSRRIPYDSSEKITAKNLGASLQTGGEDSGMDSSNGEPMYKSLKISGLSAEGEEKNISLDPAEIPDGTDMKPRKIAVCKDGYLAHAYVLMTDPETEENQTSQQP